MASLTKASTVKFMRDELASKLEMYYLIRDCIEGQDKIKKQKTKYLPKPNPEDLSEANCERYTAYLLRALFYNATRHTLKGMTGQAFLHDAKIELPLSLEIMFDDADGSGVSIEQLAKKSVSNITAFGREGLLIDYPLTDGKVTLADIKSGKVRPIFKRYDPWRIINWRTTANGSEVVLTMVVLEEVVDLYDDDFSASLALQWRVLKLGPTKNNPDVELDENAYTIEVWNETELISCTQPKDSSGKFIDRIPFVFCGSENNDADIDYPPLYDLASINIAHYRNSADYEDSCYLVGQPTPVFAGLDEYWVKNVLKNSVSMGSRGGVPLPAGADAKLLQPAENTMAREAMRDKERQMVALGAKLVERQDVQRTATEVIIESIGEHSQLTNIVNNVSAAYYNALVWACRFTGDSFDNIVFELNTDFEISNVSTAERIQTIAEWQTGAITFDEMRSVLRKATVATEDDKSAEEKIIIERNNSVNLGM